MKVCRIYTLSCPVTKEIRYVGKTTQSLSHRLSGHCSEYGLSVKTKWVRCLQAELKKPTIELIEECDVSDASEIESYWIWQMSAWGFRLLNDVREVKDSKRPLSKKIVIPRGTILECLSLKQHGDMVAIADILKTTPATVNLIFLSGKAFPDQFRVIRDFYSERVKALKTLGL